MSKPPNETSNPNLIEPSRIDPMTEQNEPDKGTKLFVLFFFLLVPPLGVALLALMCWTMWKTMTS
jgi:hypothetical protein